MWADESRMEGDNIMMMDEGCEASVLKCTVDGQRSVESILLTDVIKKCGKSDFFKMAGRYLVQYTVGTSLFRKQSNFSKTAL